jgi:hypothetical protein
MFRIPLVLVFIVMAVLCWGMYAPFLHEGQMAMSSSRWRPFICVGFAYFLVAVCIPTFLMTRGTETGRWTLSGTVWSLIAGALGCLGSLGILFAFDFGGRPIYVMPIVFGCAPVVNTLVTAFVHRAGRPNAIFVLGIALVAVGAAGVLYFKPEVQRGSAAASKSTTETAIAGEGKEKEVTSDTQVTASPTNKNSPRPLWIFLSIACTALCWGTYGPALHQGQIRMLGSRLRPFICVGISYFFLAIVVPLFVLALWPDGKAWTWMGSLWSTVAGALGALGALGIILAFNSGGKPVFVMPLVFGGAPVINTMTSSVWAYQRTGELPQISNPFLLSLALAITGAAMVLIFAPKAVPHPKPA